MQLYRDTKTVCCLPLISVPEIPIPMFGPVFPTALIMKSLVPSMTGNTVAGARSTTAPIPCRWMKTATSSCLPGLPWCCGKARSERSRRNQQQRSLQPKEPGSRQRRRLLQKTVSRKKQEAVISLWLSIPPVFTGEAWHILRM